jgi:hypothetical protein
VYDAKDEESADPFEVDEIYRTSSENNGGLHCSLGS